jgi:hypothetical protein
MELEIFKWIVMTLGGIVVWFMRKTISDTQEDIQKMKAEMDSMKQKYLHKDDFKEFKADLWNMFNEIKQDIREIKNSNG